VHGASIRFARATNFRLRQSRVRTLRARHVFWRCIRSDGTDR